MNKVLPSLYNKKRVSRAIDLDDVGDDCNITVRSVPENSSSDEEEAIRDNIQRLIRKEDNKSDDLDDRSNAMDLLSLRQTMEAKIENKKKEPADGQESYVSGALKLGSRVPFGIILPESNFMTYWTVIVVIALAYTATFMPYFITFYDIIPYNWLIVEMLFDCVFMFDLLLNFNMAYYEKYDLVVSRSKIFKNYAIGWLATDLLACFPFSLISLISSGNDEKEAKLLKMAKFPRVYKIIRIFRLIKVLKTAKFINWYNETMERFNISATLSIGIKFMIVILVLLHLTSCGWYFIDKLDNFSPGTWVVRNHLEDRTNDDIYLFSIYWGLTVLDTIGYGDITPLIINERVLCLIWLVFGVSFYSYAISNLSVIFYNMNTKENYIRRKEEYLKEFAHNVKLPKPLLKKVKFYVRYNYKHNVFCWSDMNNFLKELPSKLYTKVYTHIFKGVLDNITFFKSKPPAFISELMPLMKTVVVHEGYELYSHGSPPLDVFFLVEGRVMVKDKKDAVLFSYVTGSYFGEIELLYKTHRKTSIQVEQTARLFKVDGQDFLSIIQRFQEIKDEVEEVASKRYQYYLERKKKFQEARKKLDELQKKKNINLVSFNPLLSDIIKMKIDQPATQKPEEETQKEVDDYQSLTEKISTNVNEIKNKVSEINEFYNEVAELKKEYCIYRQETTLKMLEKLLDIIEKKII